MKTSLLNFGVVIALMASGCAHTTQVNDLGLPPVTTIEGAVTQVNENGFSLMDDSGSILVSAKLTGNKKLDLSLNEKVKVYGNLRGGGTEKIFDGYVIKKPSGEQIIVSNPTPHFGLIVQSAFK